MITAGGLGEEVWMMIVELEQLVELADPVVACPWFECVAIVSRRVASERQCEVPGGAADIAIAVELVVTVVHHLSSEEEFDCCAAA